MAEIVKFIYVMIIFFSLFLDVMKVDGKPFLSFTNFHNYFVRTQYFIIL